MFEALYPWLSVSSRAHTRVLYRCLNLCLDSVCKFHPPQWKFMVRCFEHDDHLWFVHRTAIYNIWKSVENITDMWQSRVEMEGYSIAYFDRIVAFEAPYRWTSIKGGAHMRFVDSWDIHTSTKRVWAPSLTEAQRYGTSKATMRLKYTTE